MSDAPEPVLTSKAAEIARKFVETARYTNQLYGLWEGTVVDDTLMDSRTYDVVTINDDWDHVRHINGGKRYERDSVKVLDDVVEVTSHTWETVVDTEALADMAALAEKWKAQGKTRLGDFLNLSTDSEYDETVTDLFSREQERTVTEWWPIAETQFLKSQPTEIRIPKFSRITAYSDPTA